MADRLQWIRLAPASWIDWEPVRGGLRAHELVGAHYAGAACRVIESDPVRAEFARRALTPAWWRRWQAPAPAVHAQAPEGGAQMLWANMALHLAADPQALIGQWHRALAIDGFVMFSCLGPDSLRELRQVYTDQGWPPAGPQFTDMHDWGDMLVHAGFAEPVMDMERLTLTWSSAQALLDELRGLGLNLHPERFPGLRGRRWKARLLEALSEGLGGPDGRLALTFEVVYGHALRPARRPQVAAESALSLEDMRHLLQAERPR